MHRISGLALASQDYRTLHAVASTSRYVYTAARSCLPARCPCGARLLQKPRHYSSWSTWDTLEVASSIAERDSINGLFFYPSYSYEASTNRQTMASNYSYRPSAVAEAMTALPTGAFHRSRWKPQVFRPGLSAHIGLVGTAGPWSTSNLHSHKPPPHRNNQSLRSAVTMSDPASQQADSGSDLTRVRYAIDATVSIGSQSAQNSHNSTSTESEKSDLNPKFTKAYTIAKRRCDSHRQKALSQAIGTNDDHCTEWLQLLTKLPEADAVRPKEYMLLYKDVRGLFLHLLKYLLRFDDAENIDRLLSEWEAKHGSKPRPAAPLSAYNILLQAYVQRADSVNALKAVERLRSIGQHSPNVYTYTNLVTLHAYRRNPGAAFNAFRAISEMGLEPTQASYASLMNAYIEAGNFDKALPIFEFLDSHADAEHPLKPDVHTCTTLLKAMVLMGSPLDDVNYIYNRLALRNIRPSSKTFALLLQSACDAERLDFAEAMFAKVDRGEHRINDPDFGSPLNVYTFTIMIRGLLRAGHKDAARTYYDEMLQRGIEPSSATWSVLIAAYSSDARDRAACMIAEDLLNEFLRTYIASAKTTCKRRLYAHDKALARGTALHSAYGPMIASYARMVSHAAEPVTGYTSDPTYQAQLLTAVLIAKSPTQALTTFQSMLAQHKSTPSIPTYSALLDAYRRTGDINGLKEIWRAVYGFAKQDHQQGLPSEASGDSRPVATRSNALCLPLSIYIDAMSSAGQHDEVAAVWAQAQGDGFGFDAANWNHLAVALLRANALERALWVTETVLLAPQRPPLSHAAPQELHDNALLPVPKVAAQTTSLDDERTLSRTAINLRDAQQIVLETRAETPSRPPNRTSEYHDKRHHSGSTLYEYHTPLAANDPTWSAEERNNHSIATGASSTAAHVAIADQYWLARTRKYDRTWTVFNDTVMELQGAIERRRGEGKAAYSQNIMEDLLERFPLSIAEINQRRQSINMTASRLQAVLKHA